MPSGVTFSAIDSGELHTCARTTTGTAYCWGSNNNDQLGNGTSTDSNIPVAVTMPSSVSFSVIAVGRYHTCARTTTDTAYCWGKTYAGELGNGTTTDSNVPVAVTMPGGVAFSAIASGLSYTCALTTTGTVYCWGANSYGQLGTCDLINRNVPTLLDSPCVPITVTPTRTAVMMPTGVVVSAVATGYEHSCAVTTTGTAYCWGFNYKGQLGNGTTTASNVPVAVTMPNNIIFSAITVSGTNSCALTTTGTVYCWGTNGDQGIDITPTIDSTTPVAVTMPANVSFSAISNGYYHTCALTTTGTA
jgi:alpha-tubulin suppressor-like RCC1 family protein